ncbi:MAG: 2-C-methyl-D-erythritol 4-phosphate cytidylyltransferase [Defluviitaleaceae bacterium]|nr:2-C-methyl-D-erythritol 4-phosphate cytidylyltransferase [Defluviitaleaceae bacterium]
MGCSDSSVIIVAGGKGERLGGDVRKQYLKLSGRSILGHTVRTFAGLEEIGEIVVAAPGDDIEFISKELLPVDLDEYASDKAIKVIRGGETRQDSARAGLAALDVSSRVVLIHDAVRPFTQREHILQVIERAREYGGSILAVPVNDTLKCCEKGFVTRTIPRDGLYAAQTPQAFDVAKLRRAHDLASSQGLRVTDDASLFEELGYEVSVVIGSALNIKITTEEDLALARMILEISK